MARSVDLTSLAARASRALDKGKLDAARKLYSKLEGADPENPEWPRHLATIHARQQAPQLELNALLRCATCEAERGELGPAVATAKMILCIDPSHAGAQQLLDRCEPDQATVSVTYDGEARPAREAKPPALDELVLTDILEGSHVASISDGPLEGVHEIPLDVVVSEPSNRRPRTKRQRTEGAGTRTGSEVSWIVTHLEQSSMFRSLPESTVTKLAQHVRVVELAAGQELFHQGDPAGALYIVAQGAVVPIAEEEPRTRLGVLEQGEIFGEIALFTDQPRNASVEALVDTQLVEIDRPVTWKLVRKHPEVLSMLLGFLRDRLIDRLVRTSPLFRIFSTTKRSAIARRFRFLEVADGHRVVEQHRPAEAVFILLSGHMDVVHEAGAGEHDGAAGGEELEELEELISGEVEKTLATIGPGELFGEMSLLWREPSLASVVARGKCWLLALPSQSFQELLDHHPQLAAMAATIAEERRSQNQRTMRDALGHRNGRAGII